MKGTPSPSTHEPQGAPLHADHRMSLEEGLWGPTKTRHQQQGAELGALGVAPAVQPRAVPVLQGHVQLTAPHLQAHGQPGSC